MYMFVNKTTHFLIIILLLSVVTSSCTYDLNVLDEVRTVVVEAKSKLKSTVMVESTSVDDLELSNECERLYDESEVRLSKLVVGHENFSVEDVRMWLSGVLANHYSCLDGLVGSRLGRDSLVSSNVTVAVGEALALFTKSRSHMNKRLPGPAKPDQTGGMLVSWNPTMSRADFVVAKDGSGTHRSIKEALTTISIMDKNRSQRIIIYIKSGIYNEKIEIDKDMKNIMLVGDGMDRTIITNNQNVPDGSTTYGSATFGVSGDGFWARDMTFENTAGPHKHQAVALRVSSDLSVFYQCSFKGYQDTLFTHSLRQFYRDCHIYGTIDFIFGDAAAVFQNCDIIVRRPMNHQGNMITAQGRDNPNEPTGISIQHSRVRPAPELEPVKNRFKSYLGRPWKKFSRTVFLKTDIDGLIDPRGWREWSGNFALSTLYYGEFMNTGAGAGTSERVNWPGFHVLRGEHEATPFTVNRFIQGDFWIPVTGVPFSAGV